MRASAIALIAALGLVAAPPAALARPWADPAHRVTFDLPSGWSQEVRDCPDCTFVDAFNPSRDCYVLAKPREGATLITPGHVRTIMRDETHITNEIWTSNANSIPAVFPNDSATFVSRSLDESGFWPIQRAEYTNADGKHVHGAMQLRQNAEIWAFCVVSDGTDTASDYDAFFRSIGTPTDATLQAEVVAAEAAAAAAPPPPPPPPAAHQNTHH